MKSVVLRNEFDVFRDLGFDVVKHFQYKKQGGTWMPLLKVFCMIFDQLSAVF